MTGCAKKEKDKDKRDVINKRSATLSKTKRMKIITDHFETSEEHLPRSLHIIIIQAT